MKKVYILVGISFVSYSLQAGVTLEELQKSIRDSLRIKKYAVDKTVCYLVETSEENSPLMFTYESEIKQLRVGRNSIYGEYGSSTVIGLINLLEEYNEKLSKREN